MKRKQAVKAPRIHFADEERADPAMAKPIRQAEKAADTWENVRAKMTGRRRASLGREIDASTGKTAVRLRFDDEIRRPRDARHVLRDSASAQVHRQISEDGDDNSGVQAMHELEKASESAVRMGEQLHYTVESSAYNRLQKAEKRMDKANLSALYAREKRNAPKKGSNPLSRWQQKRAIRRAYMTAKYHPQLQPFFQTAAAAPVVPARTVGKVRSFMPKGPNLFPVIALILMFVFLLSSLSSCTPISQSVMQLMVIGNYPADEADVLAAENAYLAMEDALREEMDRYTQLYPGYDEYTFDLDDIWHDPYVLMAIISAYHNGEEWTIDTAYPVLELFFGLQYVVTETVVTAADSHSVMSVTLENRNLSYLPIYYLSDEQVGLYALYMSTLGNMPDLFAGNPHASQLTEPLEYDVPQELLDADPQFAALVTEAEKYIGFPYVWGGASPETSFDCSGFVSWVYTNSGVYDIGRLGATGLYGMCSAVSPYDARPGDLVFFSGTMGADVGGITHVGIYVGNGMMIHCGNPISYADLSDSYWQQHFDSFGRVPY